MADVFISYSRKDSAFVRELQAALEGQGREVWVDWEDIPPTADWLAEIRGAIEAADAFVFVISPDSAASEMCAREVEHAVALNKRLVPILRRDVPARALPERISAHNWIAFREGDDADAALATLLAALDLDLAWTKAHTRLLGRAGEWERRGRSGSFLLRKEDLRDAEERLARVGAALEPQPTPLQREYVLASRRAATRGLQRLVGSLLVGGAVVLALAVLSFSLFRVAESRRTEAVSQRQRAEEEARIARGRQIAAQSVNFAATKPDLALLLAQEADRILDTEESRGSLRETIERNPRLVTYLRTDGAPLNGVVFSPDGRSFASGGVAGTVQVWETAGRAPQGDASEIGVGTIRGLAYSPDGRTLAVGGEAGATALWDVAERRVRGYPLGGRTGATSAVAFSPDGAILAVGGEDRAVVLWDARTGEPLGTPLTGQEEAVTGLAFSPDGRRLASGSSDGTVVLWDVAARRQVEELSYNRLPVNSVAFSPDGQLVAGGRSDGTVVLWETAGGKVRGEPYEMKGYVTTVAFSPDGKTLAAGAVSGAIALWEVATGRQKGDLLAGHGNWVRQISFHPDGKTMLSAGIDGALIVWEPERRSALATALNGPQNNVALPAFSPDGATLAYAAITGPILLWDVAARRLRERHLVGGFGVATVLAYSPDGNTLVAYTRDGALSFWDVPGRRRVGAVTDNIGEVTALAFSGDGRRVISGSSEGIVNVYDVASRRRVVDGRTEQRARVNDIAFLPDGERIIWADGFVRVVDLKQDRYAELRFVEPGRGEFGAYSMAVSPDGTMLATGDLDGNVNLWAVETAQQIGETLVGHTGVVTSVAFSPDGRTLASASVDGGVVLWDLASRRPLGRPFTGHRQPVYDVRFSPDGRTLVSTDAGSLSFMFIWPLDAQVWRARACEIANRNLTAEEWTTYFGAEPYRKTCPDE